MSKSTIAFVMCGSFCTLQKAISQMNKLVELGYNILPIMSFNAATIDTRFGTAKNFQKQIENISGKEIIKTIQNAEPIGPKNMADIMVVAPCTGNTIGKMCNGITDTPATMAIKSHLRVKKPIVIALATNDALGMSGKNIAKLMNIKNIYFVPLRQDDPEHKPNSLVCDFDMLIPTIDMALLNCQIQPIFM